jgi:hypothetical protein
MRRGLAAPSPGHASRNPIRTPLGVKLAAPFVIAASTVGVPELDAAARANLVGWIWAVPWSKSEVESTYGAETFAVYGIHDETPYCLFQ